MAVLRRISASSLDRRLFELCRSRRMATTTPCPGRAFYQELVQGGVRYHGPVKQMFSSEATTRNVRVRVQARYDPSRSSPQQSQWFFLYTVSITNEGQET